MGSGRGQAKRVSSTSAYSDDKKYRLNSDIKIENVGNETHRQQLEIYARARANPDPVQVHFLDPRNPAPAPGYTDMRDNIFLVSDTSPFVGRKLDDVERYLALSGILEHELTHCRWYSKDVHYKFEAKMKKLASGTQEEREKASFMMRMSNILLDGNNEERLRVNEPFAFRRISLLNHVWQRVSNQHLKDAKGNDPLQLMTAIHLEALPEFELNQKHLSKKVKKCFDECNPKIYDAVCGSSQDVMDATEEVYEIVKKHGLLPEAQDLDKMQEQQPGGQAQPGQQAQQNEQNADQNDAKEGSQQQSDNKQDGQGQEGEGQEGEGQEGEGQDGQGQDGQGQDGEGQDGQGQDGEGQDGQGQDGEGQDGQGQDGQGQDGEGQDGQGQDGEGQDGQGQDGQGQGNGQSSSDSQGQSGGNPREGKGQSNSSESSKQGQEGEGQGQNGQEQSGNSQGQQQTNQSVQRHQGGDASGQGATSEQNHPQRKPSTEPDTSQPGDSQGQQQSPPPANQRYDGSKKSREKIKREREKRTVSDKEFNQHRENAQEQMESNRRQEEKKRQQGKATGNLGGDAWSAPSHDSISSEKIIGVGAGNDYTDSRGGLAKYGRKLGAQLEELKMQKEARQKFQKYGKLDAKRLSKVPTGNEKVFFKRGEGLDVDISASVILDLSGSMNGYRKQLQDASIVSQVAFDKIDIPHEVWGFSGFGGVDHYEYKSFESPRANGLGRIGKVGDPIAPGGGGTPTKEAIDFGTARMNQRKEQAKLMFVFTDGAPNDPHGTAMAIRNAKSKGITVLGILFDDSNYGDGAQMMNELFGPESNVVINDISDMPRIVGKHLKQVLKIK